MNQYEYLKGSHDLETLTDWGPFIRDLYGLSHIADRERGLKLDFFFVPGILRRKFFLPETLRESGCSPLEAAPDLSYFSFRQQMEGMDKLYADLAYGQIAENLWLCRCELVNKSDKLRGMSLLSYARLSPRPDVVPMLPEGARWIDALSYNDITYSYDRFDHNLTYSGGRRGEQDYPGTVGGSCVGQPYYDRELPCFAAKKGDRICYEWDSLDREKTLFLRVQAENGDSPRIECILNGQKQLLSVPATGKFELISLGCIPAKEKIRIRLTADNDSRGVRIDGFVTGRSSLKAEDILFSPIGRAAAPRTEPGPVPESFLLSGTGLKGSYALWRSMPAAVDREYWTGDLAKLVNYSYGFRHVYYHGGREYPGDEYCHDTYIVPISVPAGSSTVVHVLVGTGTDNRTASEKLSAQDRSFEALEKAYLTAKSRALKFTPVSGGEQYEFTQKITAATCLTNINFPIRARGKNIRHHVPDKYFNSLYSWDSGFIGLGFLELDKKRAIENLNVYVTEPDDDENAFILHGTPLPVQVYLYAEIWNRYQDKEMLEFFYPRLRHFYDFIAGHIPSSTFRKAQSNLLRSWDYFYNSGGWDDYPPQWYIYNNKNYEIAPAVTTAHAIRFAKILRRAALELGRNSDTALYDADIQAFTKALQELSWSEEDGIYSYVKHDKNGKPEGFWMDPESGVNFNLGMDGCSPLVSGICTQNQRKRLFERLSDPDGMWLNIGISTVDRRAPYFRTDGYWNGCVWMPHQWFFWKAALDDNRSGFAWKIADTALKIWHHEVKLSRYTFEHFSMISERGEGCCHFGGLSSPVLNWYGAYYEKGRMTAGFDTWIRQLNVTENRVSAELVIDGVEGDCCSLLFVTGGGEWNASYCGKSVSILKITESCISVTLPKHSNGILTISDGAMKQ